ncbi:MAG: GTPase, partial [Acutalibacteraceae bacterium]|nr:GTPase [Acutalibacteraceae bacterium]
MRFDKVKYEASYGTAQQLPASEHIEIAFAGRSNVGKSSMLNKILNRKNLARVSSVPGKTVTVNFFDCDGIKLVDLPGYG